MSGHQRRSQNIAAKRTQPLGLDVPTSEFIDYPVTPFINKICIQDGLASIAVSEKSAVISATKAYLVQTVVLTADLDADRVPTRSNSDSLYVNQPSSLPSVRDSQSMHKRRHHLLLWQQKPHPQTKVARSSLELMS